MQYKIKTQKDVLQGSSKYKNRCEPTETQDNKKMLQQRISRKNRRCYQTDSKYNNTC